MSIGFFLSFTSRPIQMLRLRRVAAQYKNRGARAAVLHFNSFYFTIDCYPLKPYYSAFAARSDFLSGSVCFTLSFSSARLPLLKRSSVPTR